MGKSTLISMSLSNMSQFVIPFLNKKRGKMKMFGVKQIFRSMGVLMLKSCSNLTWMTSRKVETALQKRKEDIRNFMCLCVNFVIFFYNLPMMILFFNVWRLHHDLSYNIFGGGRDCDPEEILATCSLLKCIVANIVCGDTHKARFFEATFSGSSLLYILKPTGKTRKRQVYFEGCPGGFARLKTNI